MQQQDRRRKAFLVTVRNKKRVGYTYEITLQVKGEWAIGEEIKTFKGNLDIAEFSFGELDDLQEAQSAINDLTGKWLGSRQIRCNWATKGAGIGDENQASDLQSVVELTNGSSEDVKEPANNDAPENNPQYTTVYVGNLAPKVTQLELHRHFHSLGAGLIEEVRVQRDKCFGFVRYSNHAEAALAIQMGNTLSILYGKQIKVFMFSFS